MKPYYKDNMVTIYHGDCKEVLPTLEPVDLVLTDIPYSRESTGIEFGDDYVEWLEQRFELAFEILSERCAVVTACSPPQIFLLRRVLEASGFDYKGLHAWCSTASFYPSSFWNPSWEPLMVGSKGKLHMLQKVGGLEGVNYNDSTVAIRPRKMEHPATKPIGLFKKYIIGFDAQVVLDPFMGSGTTLRAAKDLGRKSIGIEIEERYCEIAVQRMLQSAMMFNAV